MSITQRSKKTRASLLRFAARLSCALIQKQSSKKGKIMMKNTWLLLALGSVMLFLSNSLHAQNPRPVSWADCETFDGVVAPNTLPMKGNFDQLYMMPGFAFLDGVPLISESKPGDRDYNGGRWHVNVLKEGVDPAKYAEACSVEHLDLGDFEGTGVFFTCPLLPRND